MSNLQKIINIKHNYGSKMYNKNQVFSLFNAKCLSNILIWVIDFHKFFLFFLLSKLGKIDMQFGKILWE